MQGLPHDVPLSEAGARSSWYANMNGDGDGNGNGDDSGSACGTDGGGGTDVSGDGGVNGGGGDGDGGGGVNRRMNCWASVLAIRGTDEGVGELRRRRVAPTKKSR